MSRAGTALSLALEERRGTGARVAHYASFTGESIDGTGTVTETSTSEAAVARDTVYFT